MCLSVCLSAAVCPHYCTDPGVTWGSGRGCPLVVHYWADLQSVWQHYGNAWQSPAVIRQAHRTPVQILELLGRLSGSHTVKILRSDCTVYCSPFPQIDIIGAVVIVWMVRGKTIRSVLCSIVSNSCAQCDAHTYEQTNSSLDWVLSHWAHFTVLRFISVLCITVCCMHA